MFTLSNILKLNAISSGVTGLLLLVLPGTLSPIMGVSNKMPLVGVGGFLVVFAIFVFEVSLGKPIKSKLVKTVIVLDTAWVVMSAIAMIFLLPVLTLLGNVLVIGVATWVAAMVYLQKKALRQIFADQQVS